MMAVLLPVIIGFAGVAVDVRNGYLVRAMLQHAVDDGALSALRWSAQAGDAPGRGPGTVSEAVAEAVRIVRQELRSDGITAISDVVATVFGRHLTITAGAHVPTFFLTIFGIGHWSPRVRADAALWAPRALSMVPPSEGGRLEFIALSAPVIRGEGNSALDVLAQEVSASGPASPGTSSSPDPGTPTDAAGPCNCDAIAAGDPQTARDALDRMGATPADPGPFGGDLTSAMGFGDMQSSPGRSEPQPASGEGDE